jgi:hypothetical protein
MAVTVWNIKLLGGLTANDFNEWITAANVPTGYHFEVDDSNDANGRYWGDEENAIESPIFMPDTDNTIVIEGVTDNFIYNATVFEGHRGSMSVGSDAFANGTELFSLILNTDGLLRRDVLGKLFDAVDLGAWIAKNQPSALTAYNNAESLVDSNGNIDETNPDGEKLKNAMCHYVVSVLAIWKNSKTTGNPTATTANTLMSVQTQKPIRKSW